MAAKGQVVVITDGENAREVYMMHTQNEDGLLLLAKQGKAHRGIKHYIKPSRLAKCDPT